MNKTFIVIMSILSALGLGACAQKPADANSHKDIVKNTPNANHLEGLELLTDKFQGEGIVSQYEKIDGWLKEFGF